jgi:uncharacterized membrane protein YgcG
MRRSFGAMILGLALAALLGFGSMAVASEAILSFGSMVRISEKGELTVTETIVVRAEGNLIRRGIYRDFPTTYRDREGRTVRVPFKVERVLRDGKPEGWHTEGVSNGVRVYIGSKDVILPPGRYRYDVTYRTARQVGFFDRHDEIYWNVTGNGWALPIASAACRIYLPKGGHFTKLDAFTGPMGSTGRDAKFKIDDDGSALFWTTKPLGPYEGLTVAAAFPKGIVRNVPPKVLGLTARLWRALSYALGALAVGFLFITWYRVGRDPERGTVIPRFYPPEGLSPPMARALIRMGFDHKCLACAIVDAAVKGFVTIDRAGRNYLITLKAEDMRSLPRELAVVLANLFTMGTKEISLVQGEHQRLRNALTAMKGLAEDQLEGTYYRSNTIPWLGGVLLSLLSVGALMASALDVQEGLGLFMGLWLTGWTVGVLVLGINVIGAWRGFRSYRSFRSFFKALFLTLFFLPFLAGELFGIYILQSVLGPVPTGQIILLGTLCGVFKGLMKAPTREGRRLMDELEGFKMFLAITEKDRLDRLNPPEMSLQTFESYLPYAMALDVENRWSERFSQMAQEAASRGEISHAYVPLWYHGNLMDLGRDFGESLSSGLAASIASASTPPGSSSGFGGGGSSGGGGGGGGGGGW